MKKFVFLVAGLLPLFTLASFDTQAIQPILGNWKVIKYFNAANIGASDQVLQSKIGEMLTINSEGDSFEGLTTNDCPYQSTTVIENNVEQYFQKIYQADSKKLPLIPPILEIDTYCESIFYDKNVNQYIVFESNGDFFKAVRSSNS